MTITTNFNIGDTLFSVNMDENEKYYVEDSFKVDRILLICEFKNIYRELYVSTNNKEYGVSLVFNSKEEAEKACVLFEEESKGID